MFSSNLNRIRALDLYCGVGGSSLGARLAGVEVVAAIDRWALARDTFKDNFPAATFYRRKAEKVKPQEIIGDTGGSIQLLLASPECTNHTCAKGNGERSEESRRTAFQVIRFARVLRPRWIVVENVIHMRSWNRYPEWLAKLCNLGYKVTEQILNAAHFSVPQSRKRLFVICDLEHEPLEVLPVATARIRTAREIVNPNGTYRFSRLKTDNRAAATLERAERAMANVGAREPFLLVYYGTDGSGGWQSLDRPLRTITTVDRFAFVRPNHYQHEMRMLQVPELRSAMGFPEEYQLNHGTRRDKIKLLGNAVCPPVMSAILKSLTSDLTNASSRNLDGSTKLHIYADSKI
ncbi:MAG: DNA cytosine methyltransferase [Candidatus Micrarchaeaceae archaeon]